MLVSNLAKSFVVEVPRVTGNAGDEHLGVEKTSVFFETVVIDEAGGGVDLGGRGRGVEI